MTVEQYRYDIPRQELTQEFLDCLRAADEHITNIIKEKELTVAFTRIVGLPTFLDHLAFTLGNQVFCIYVAPDNEDVNPPNGIEGLMTAAEGQDAYPCLLWMTQEDGKWIPKYTEGSEWGLIDQRNGQYLIPEKLITHELKELTYWEIYETCNFFVMQELDKNGFRVTSIDSNPRVEPGLWVEDESGEDYFVIVDPIPLKNGRPMTQDEIKGRTEGLLERGLKGFYAPVYVVGRDQEYDDEGYPTGEPAPLHRGDGYRVIFDGVESLGLKQ